MKRWNLKTQSYEPYSVPEDWFCPIYCNDMDEAVNCPNCGKKILFGDGYSSRFIHNDKGLGYSVCLKCHEQEIEKERNNS